jgi:hypothetical protein
MLSRKLEECKPLDMGRVSEDAEKEQVRMEKKLAEQNKLRALMRERIKVCTVVVRAMEQHLAGGSFALSRVPQMAVNALRIGRLE